MAYRTAKLFRNGASQAVRLPKEYRFDGDRVRIRRIGKGVLLEPMAADVGEWLKRLRRLAEKNGPFMPEGRRQPPMPARRKLFP